MTDPGLKFIFEVNINLDPPLELDLTRYGQRRIINIKGGIVTGPDIQGTILPGGADWQTVRSDGTIDISAKYTIQTDDGEYLFLKDRGIRTLPEKVLQKKKSGKEINSSEYVMRTSATIEANYKGKYDWLNRSILVSAGFRKENSIVIRFYKVT